MEVTNTNPILKRTDIFQVISTILKNTFLRFYCMCFLIQIHFVNNNKKMLKKSLEILIVKVNVLKLGISHWVKS